MRARWASIGLLFFLSSFGCAGLRGRADSAFERGDYEAAARDYAQLVAKDPADQELRGRLAQARERVFLGILSSIAESRRGGNKDRAIEGVGNLLQHARDWNDRGSPAIQQRTREEMTWVENEITTECGVMLDKNAPLLADAHLSARERQVLRHPDFAPIKSTIHDAIMAAGAARCGKLAPATPGTNPYLSDLIGKYCAHFNVQTPRVPVLPFHISQVVLGGEVEGMSLEGRDAFAAALRKGLETSVFWDPRAEVSAVATIQGKNRASFRSQPRTLSRPWVEQVAYQATEEYQEAYTEYYQDTETYFENEPYTDHETYTHTCSDGKSTCTDSRPVTKYRQVSRTRPVTRNRTAYRTKTRPVTKYREENRVFTFEAVERSANYEVDVGATIDLKQGISPFAVHLSTSERKSGLDHDSSFPPAGVEPSRANLPSREAFWTAQLPTIVQRTSSSANVHWAASFCSQGAYSAEEAARCYYVPAAEHPKPAHEALLTAIGPDIDAMGRP
ncbi:tetratricopeptide repeat protein [Pendulispora brunnea]|uniref:Tetratricopeptide repeat protein n=1 Tax=Pendulispora brunnea TaxID=2905690 RepID=A0ABZ2KCN5_9BACT